MAHLVTWSVCRDRDSSSRKSRSIITNVEKTYRLLRASPSSVIVRFRCELLDFTHFRSFVSRSHGPLFFGLALRAALRNPLFCTGRVVLWL